MASMACSRCGALAVGDGDDLARPGANCPSCKAVLDPEQVVASRERRVRAAKLEVPAGLTVIGEIDAEPPADNYRQRPRRSTGTLSIVQRWGGWPSQALAVAAPVVLLLFVAALAQEPSIPTDPFRALFAASLAALIIATGMLGAVWSINRTTVAIHAGHVRVVHGPIPLRSGTSLPCESLRRVGVAVTRADLLEGGFSYSVTGETTDEATEVIVTDLPNEASACFIATVLSERLGLPEPL
jgi:hypothetical protein